VTWWAWLIIGVVVWFTVIFTVAMVASLRAAKVARKEFSRASEVNLGPRRRSHL
jgi:hypothetical protein